MTVEGILRRFRQQCYQTGLNENNIRWNLLTPIRIICNGDDKYTHTVVVKIGHGGD